jgi:hypothetical protein
MPRTFNENNAVRMIHTPGSHAASAHYGEWVDMTGYRRCTFIMSAGELDGDMAVAAYRDSDGAASDPEALSGLSESFVNGTDESRVGIIEVREADLDADHPYVTIAVTPTAADGFACIAVLSEPYEVPVSNETTDGVAFNVGE